MINPPRYQRAINTINLIYAGVMCLGLLVGAVAICFNRFRAAVAPKPMGARAPAFGSSPEFATTSGFLQGKWIEVPTAENRFAQSQKGLDEAIGLVPASLVFKSDGTATFQDGLAFEPVVDLRWHANGVGINLELVDVGGRSIAQVESDYQAYEASRPGGNPNDRRMRRREALRGIEEIKRMTLTEDKKSLIDEWQPTEFTWQRASK